LLRRRLQALSLTTVRDEDHPTNRVYDAMAATYGFDVGANLSSRLKYDLVLKFIKPDYNLLDVGCANGIHMRLLAPHCRHITGIDVNAPMLAIARQALVGAPNATLELRSASALGFPDSSFDLVYSFSTLLLVPEFDLALAEIARVLKLDGIALLDITGRWNLSRLYWSHFYRRHGHFGVHAFGYREIVNKLERHGLRLIESHALGFLDQWRYIPGIHWCKWLNRVLHRSVQNDLDYAVSNNRLVFTLANRWYLACRKVD
jgi:ubiquinone/menaquinone biosynthesis C-methylase UbiE